MKNLTVAIQGVALVFQWVGIGLQFSDRMYAACAAFGVAFLFLWISIGISLRSTAAKSD
jgi:hypothetical protein